MGMIKKMLRLAVLRKTAGAAAAGLLLLLPVLTGLSCASGSQAVQSIVLDEETEEVRKNPNVNIQDSMGRTALHIAVEKSDILKSARLLNEGADPNLTDKKGQSALHLAVMAGNPDMVAMLLAAGADASLEDRRKESPLNLARGNNRENILEIILSSLEEFQAQ